MVDLYPELSAGALALAVHPAIVPVERTQYVAAKLGAAINKNKIKTNLVIGSKSAGGAP